MKNLMLSPLNVPMIHNSCLGFLIRAMLTHEEKEFNYHHLIWVAARMAAVKSERHVPNNISWDFGVVGLV